MSDEKIRQVNLPGEDAMSRKYHSMEAAITSLFRENIHMIGRQPVYGGDINRSFRLSLSDGTSVFMKCNEAENVAFFECETEGLNALRRTETIGVPKPLAVGVDEAKNISFLLMEYLTPASRRRQDYWETLGHELAQMHRWNADELGTGFHYGFRSDNYIGATPQKNRPKPDWITFFRECRLIPQLQMAEHWLDTQTRQRCDRLLEHLDAFLEEPAFPSLLHGDLWSGNVVCGPDGKAWILDPAVYVGSFEAELAMTELFGGYPPAFYEAYREVNQIDSGYRDRRDLYNLYHMLNHLNLFGASYLGEVKRILRKYAG